MTDLELLKKALSDLVFAASSRENVMGDPCSFIAAKARLQSEIKNSMEVLKKVENI